MEKHSVSRLSYLFSRLHLLSSDSFSSTLLSSNLSLLSASSLLCFSSVHIVGSLTSKLPSIMEDLVTLAKNESSKQQTSYPENKIVVLRDESAKFPLIAQMMTSRGLEAFSAKTVPTRKGSSARQSRRECLNLKVRKDILIGEASLEEVSLEDLLQSSRSTEELTLACSYQSINHTIISQTFPRPGTRELKRHSTSEEIERFEKRRGRGGS